jgi:hypothetical protein
MLLCSFISYLCGGLTTHHHSSNSQHHFFSLSSLQDRGRRVRRAARRRLPHKSASLSPQLHLFMHASVSEEKRMTNFCWNFLRRRRRRNPSSISGRAHPAFLLLPPVENRRHHHHRLLLGVGRSIFITIFTSRSDIIPLIVCGRSNLRYCLSDV